MTVSYFSRYFSRLETAIFKEQRLVAAFDLHRLYKSYLFMTLCGYPVKQNLLKIGQEVVSTTP